MRRRDLRKRPPEHYRLLNAIRLEDAWDRWISFFLEGVSTIADESAGTDLEDGVQRFSTVGTTYTYMAMIR